MAVVLRLSATVQSGQPILVQSYPKLLHNTYSPGDQSGDHCYSSGVIQKLRGQYEVGRCSKNAFYIGMSTFRVNDVHPEVGRWSKKNNIMST